MDIAMTSVRVEMEMMRLKATALLFPRWPGLLLHTQPLPLCHYPCVHLALFLFQFQGLPLCPPLFRRDHEVKRVVSVHLEEAGAYLRSE
jgi:hypothetical protein